MIDIIRDTFDDLEYLTAVQLILAVVVAQCHGKRDLECGNPAKYNPHGFLSVRSIPVSGVHHIAGMDDQIRRLGTDEFLEILPDILAPLITDHEMGIGDLEYLESAFVERKRM